MRSRKNDRRAARLMGWLSFAPEAVRNPRLSKREKMLIEAGIMEAPPADYVKPGTFGPFVPMIGKFKYKVKMNAEQDYLDVALYDGTKRVGILQLSPIEKMRHVSPRCIPLIEGLNPPVGEYESIRGWYVSWSEVPEDRRGQGLGRLLYDAALDAMFKARGGWRGAPGPFVFMPGDCSNIGSTSKEARRVWPSLARDWPHKVYTSQTISGEPVHIFVIRVDHPPVFKAPRAAARAAANGRARRNESAAPSDLSLNAADLLMKQEAGTSLAHADLRNFAFNDLYLTKMDLSGVDFRKASFTNTVFAECNLEDANFEGASFENVEFKRQCRLGRVNFTKARIGGTHFRNSFMEGTIFDNAEAQSVLFWRVNWTNGSAKGTNFYKLQARGCDFRGTDFTGAYLADSRFSGVEVSPDMFVGANLTGSDLQVSRPAAPIPSSRSEAFDKWFGRSKIVNEDGTPKVLYHGTDQAGFTAFSKEKIDAWHPGFFLADKPELAQTYSGSPQLDPFATGHNKGLYRVYVRMAKPYIHDAKGSDWKSIPWGKDGIDFINTDGIGAWAKAKKYDGVIIRNVIDIGKYGGFTEPANVYIVFDPTNIKSAAYNQGTWDRKDPDIRHNPNGQPRTPRAPRRARRNEITYPWDASTKVQSLQFDKDLFTADEAKAWARQHGFRYGKVDLGQGNWLRLRQADPEHFRPSTFRVISFRDGVQAVIAVPKRSHR